jgi:hypothetical protein
MSPDLNRYEISSACTAAWRRGRRVSVRRFETARCYSSNQDSAQNLVIRWDLERRRDLALRYDVETADDVAIRYKRTLNSGMAPIVQTHSDHAKRLSPTSI